MPQLETDLPHKNKSDEREINALIDEINDRIDTHQREDVENKPADEKEDVLVAADKAFGFRESHRKLF